MSGFDLIIAAIFLVSMLVGVMRGFIREALSITSWILAIWLGITFCDPAGDFIARYISIPADAFRISAGFALIFIGTLFVFSIISYGITKMLVKGAIKGTDRVLGIGFGALRAAAVVVVVMLVARGIGMQGNDWWQNSKYLGYFEPAADYVETLLPQQLQSSAEEAMAESGSEMAEGEVGVDSVEQDVKPQN
ncbi:MAG: CvpA family protein [Gammaproteobacteria bacterium]|nr:CvpA family protein [Gammaproteobacteria bacterium]